MRTDQNSRRLLVDFMTQKIKIRFVELGLRKVDIMEMSGEHFQVLEHWKFGLIDRSQRIFIPLRCAIADLSTLPKIHIFLIKF